MTWDVVLDTVLAGSTTFGVEKIHVVGVDSLVAVCTDGRQLATTDGGTTWSVLAPSPLDNQPFYRASAFVSLQSGYIADGLHQLHKYSSTATSVDNGGEPGIATLPSVALRTVFPNPVDKATASIQVYVRQAEAGATLKIYNIQGQEVKNLSPLLATTGNAPVRTISFETADLQRGVYFLQLKSGGESDTQGFVVAQ